MAWSHSLKFNGKLTVSFHESLHHVGTWTSDNTQDSVLGMISKKLTKWITWSSGTTGERMHLYLYHLASEPLCATLCRHSIALWVIALLCLLHCNQHILSFEGIISKVMFQLYFRPAASGWSVCDGISGSLMFDCYHTTFAIVCSLWNIIWDPMSRDQTL